MPIYDEMDALKGEKRVGIVIHKCGSLFSNGIVQNAYFILQCLEHIGYKCQFLSHEADFTVFPYKSLPVICMDDAAAYRPQDYHTIITVTRGLSQEQYKALKGAKTSVAAFICGNTYMHAQEAFTLDSKDGISVFIGRGSPVDEAWVIPSYDHSLEYVSLTRGIPSFIVPHLWSPNILLEYARSYFGKTAEDLHYNVAKHVGPKIDIVIMEPNIALFKTAFMPIIAAEKVYTEHPDVIDSVYVFNFPKHTAAHRMMDNYKVSKVTRRFARLQAAEIYSFFNSRGTIPIFVSHQILNDLNYLYYELLYLGFPLVHNSARLEGCGYYYPEHDFAKCADAILYARKYHNHMLDSYKAKAAAYLERVDPLNVDVCRKWNETMHAGIARAAAGVTANETMAAAAAGGAGSV